MGPGCSVGLGLVPARPGPRRGCGCPGPGLGPVLGAIRARSVTRDPGRRGGGEAALCGSFVRPRGSCGSGRCSELWARRAGVAVGVPGVGVQGGARVSNVGRVGVQLATRSAPFAVRRRCRAAGAESAPAGRNQARGRAACQGCFQRGSWLCSSGTCGVGA